MYTTNNLDDLVNRLSALVPPPLKQAGESFEKNFRLTLENGLRGMNLVTREEFEIQKSVLLKTRQKVENLQQQLEKLEQQFLKKETTSINLSN